MNKFTLFLMSEKGYKSLIKITECFNSSIIDFIVVGEDKNVKNDYSKEIKELAKDKDIKVYNKNDDFKVQTKYSFAISWRWMIHLNNDLQLITLHDSILPKYRGFAPLVNQLINKEPFVGVSAIFANEEFDRGQIIYQLKKAIEYPIKIKEVIAEISLLYADIIYEVINKLIHNTPLNPITQNEDEATYSLWRDEEDYNINWNMSASYIQNFINSVGSPFKGASAIINGEKIRIFDTIEEQDVKIENRDVGKVLFVKEGYPIVVCGQGLLKITNAEYDSNSKSIFPLKQYRLRFK